MIFNMKATYERQLAVYQKKATPQCLKITEKKSHSNLRSISITRQVNFIRTKIVRKCQNGKTQMRYFKSFSNTVKL